MTAHNIEFQFIGWARIAGIFVLGAGCALIGRQIYDDEKKSRANGEEEQPTKGQNGMVASPHIENEEQATAARQWMQRVHAHLAEDNKTAFGAMKAAGEELQSELNHALVLLNSR